MEPAEIKSGRPGIKGMTEKLLSRCNSAIFVAATNNLLVGFISARGGECNRNRHCAYLVIGVKKGYQGRGIGKRLLQAIDIWAQGTNILRLELTVVEENQVARALYKKSGYVEEGLKIKSLYISGCYSNEISMSKIFN